AAGGSECPGSCDFANRHVAVSTSHDETSMPHVVQCMAYGRLRLAEIPSELPRLGPPPAFDGLKGAPLSLLDHAHELHPALALHHQCQAVALQHRLDGVPVVLRHPSEHEIRFPMTVRLYVRAYVRRYVRRYFRRLVSLSNCSHEQFRDDFVRAGEVDHRDVR